MGGESTKSETGEDCKKGGRREERDRARVGREGKRDSVLAREKKEGEGVGEADIKG